jgi:serine/threonine protein kinase
MRQPTKFGKYVLLERVAVGGMAEVFVAKAFGVEGFERLLAIKKILPTMGEDPEFISMFVDEARIAVQLSHANIVRVLELGKHDGHLYIAMEYIPGRDLRQLIERFRKRQQPMPIPQACRIVASVCEALDHAHRKRDSAGRPLGIVHRDVSPQNVLVSYDGEVKLIDFGIAKAETSSPPASFSGSWCAARSSSRATPISSFWRRSGAERFPLRVRWLRTVRRAWRGSSSKPSRTSRRSATSARASCTTT